MTSAKDSLPRALAGTHELRKRPPRRCRICGCTQERACEGGCYWVAPDLCSACQWRAKPRPPGEAEDAV